MFTTLHSRLLISYIVIILICLTLGALTLILVARPIQERLLTARLSAQVTLAIPRVRNLLERGLSPEQVAERLVGVTSRRDARFLLLDGKGRVLGDTDGEWGGQSVTDVPTGSNGQPQNTGTFAGPDGTAQLYAGGLARRDSGGGGVWVAAVALSPRTPGAALSDLGQGLLVAGVAALLVSAVLAALIAGSVARPLRQMAQAAEAIAAEDYDQKLDIRGPEEVRMLGQSLEAMAEQVKASQQAMRDLVANVSHDLKTPLTSIQGFAQALVEGAAQDEAARRRAASIIYEEAGRMVRMVEELLDLARIESGQVALDRNPLDLRLLLGGVAQALAPVAARRGVTFQVDLPELPPVAGDRDRLAQVFTNLLDNAFKYTSPGDRVQLTAHLTKEGPSPRRSSVTRADDSTVPSLKPEFVAVRIADTGRGIPAEELPRIFERFYQADKARTARGGSGLGLAIAQQIVEAHGGQISVESVEGLGTRFTVVLPVSVQRLAEKKAFRISR
jgi:signal transduction histidine kinase